MKHLQLEANGSNFRQPEYRNELSTCIFLRLRKYWRLVHRTPRPGSTATRASCYSMLLPLPPRVVG